MSTRPKTNKKRGGVGEVEIVSAVSCGETQGEGEVGKGREGHCFKWEWSLDLKQSMVSAATTS